MSPKPHVGDPGERRDTYAMTAARIATLGQGARTDLSPSGEKSQAEAASLLGVGKRTVERARKVLDSGDGELISKVDSGSETVSKAAATAVRKVKGNGKADRWAALGVAVTLADAMEFGAPQGLDCSEKTP